MSSRITTILNKFKLEDRFFNCNNYRLDTEQLKKLIDRIENENTDHIPDILSAEKAKASAFLDTVFNIGKDNML